MLELARRDAGVPLDLSPLELPTLARHTLAATGRPAELLTVVGDGPFLVCGDKLRLERMVVNLLDNADQHGRGVTGVIVQRRDGMVALTVQDAGPGVPADARERIFERFATVGGPRGSSPSTGLGLALVRETALAHGGLVHCRSGPGGGAQLVLQLPVAS